MSNTIAAGLKDDIIIQSALQAFTDTLMPLNVFSNDFSPEPGRRGQSVSVGVIGNMTASDFAGSYIASPDASETEVEVSMDKHIFKTVHLTDTEYANHSILKLEDFGFQAGIAVASAALAFVLAEITAANYGTAAYIGGAAGFDSDDVIDLRAACNAAKMPKLNRGLVLNGDFFTSLLKDTSIKNTAAFGDSSPVRSGEISNLAGFRTLESQVVPGNSENLVGFAATKNAMAVAMRYLAPQEAGSYLDARPVTDPDSGLTLGVRRWYDNNTGKHYLAFECLLGKKVCQSDGLKRLTSA